MDTSNLMVIEKNNSETEKMVIVSREKFETHKYCECYDQYGQLVGCTDAGCHAVENGYTAAKAELLKAIQEKFDWFTDTDLELSKTLDDAFQIDQWRHDGYYNSQVSELNDFINTWVSDNEHHTEVLAYNYHDGHNWKTVILSSENYPEPDYSELPSDKQAEILNDLENAVDSGPINNGTGTLYSGTKYGFKTSRFASDFEMYQVVELEDEEE